MKGLGFLEGDDLKNAEINFNQLSQYVGWYKMDCDLLREENRRDADQIECVFSHAFIHYENKLRTKQFFELCSHVIPDLDGELMALAVSQYDAILSFAEEIASIAHQRDSYTKDVLKEKRSQIIEMLRRSSELEALALSYIRKALTKLIPLNILYM